MNENIAPRVNVCPYQPALSDKIENASLQGSAKIFDNYLCGAIRRVTVGSDLRAAATMVFPLWGGLVDCVMSLDVCERDVEQLAMAQRRDKWVEQVLHVALNNGITMMMHTPKSL